MQTLIFVQLKKIEEIAKKQLVKDKMQQLSSILAGLGCIL